MKNIIRYFLLLALMVALIACDAPRSSQLPQSSEVAKSQPAAVKPTVVQKLTTWPPVVSTSGNDKQAAVASNLLAKNYYVVQDGSGSMKDSACKGGGSKSEVSKRALAEFAKSVPADANLGFVAFDSRGVTERLPLGVNNRNEFITKVYDTCADSNTPLHEAIELGYKKLESQARKQLGYGEYHLVIVTDGEANAGPDPRKIVNYIAENTSIVIHTIGFCISQKHSLNQPGKTEYKEANDLESLRRGLQEVLAESPVFDIAEFK